VLINVKKLNVEAKYAHILTCIDSDV